MAFSPLLARTLIPTGSLPVTCSIQSMSASRAPKMWKYDGAGGKVPRPSPHNPLPPRNVISGENTACEPVGSCQTEITMDGGPLLLQLGYSWLCTLAAGATTTRAALSSLLLKGYRSRCRLVNCFNIPFPIQCVCAPAICASCEGDGEEGVGWGGGGGTTSSKAICCNQHVLSSRKEYINRQDPQTRCLQKSLLAKFMITPQDRY